MTTQEVKRKLTAILSADVKGYSRLMGEDEEATLRTLNTYKEVMGSLIQQHRGRVVGTAGDSVLADFASVVDAVQCAVEIQQVLKAKNAVVPENRRMEFRIGINLGDVIEEGDSIYGDGVNIAARLEGLAEAGGICISESAYQQIENKLPLRYDYLGEHEVKNIAKPVRVYCARIEADAGPSKLGKEKKPAQKRLPKAALAIIAVIVIAGLVALYQFVLRPSPSKTEVASKEKMTFPLPDKPSIAVLPFVNMSEDPKQEYFSDGMTEEIITALSKVPGLFVIARNSTFTYKGKPVKVKQVSEELGVRYVLEGSVRRSGDRVRITAQLIDALSGNHLWAESYDRDLKDIFALQDDITLKVLTGVQAKLTLGAEVVRAQQKYGEKYYGGKKGLNCYLKIMEGTDYADRRTVEDNNVARRIAGDALATCPGVPTAYLLMAYVHSVDYWIGSTRSPQESIEKGIGLVQKALALDDTLAEAHGLLGFLYTQKREYDKGIAEGERAVALNPGGATVLVDYASSLNFAGRSEEAIPLLQKAIRLDPSGSQRNYTTLGNAFMFTGRYEEAVSAYKKALQYSPNFLWVHIMLTATYSMMGREEEARAEAAEVLRINPKFSLDFWARRALVRDESIRDKIFTALRKAGLK
jgi:adenylate cyclase